jgi:hypothetical protein
MGSLKDIVLKAISVGAKVGTIHWTQWNGAKFSCRPRKHISDYVKLNNNRVEDEEH